MKATTAKRVGRPPKGSGKTFLERFEVRLLPSEKQAFQEAASLSGLELSAWVRERLRAVSREELTGAGHQVPFMKPS